MSFSSGKNLQNNINQTEAQTLSNKTLDNTNTIEAGATIQTPAVIDPTRLDVKKGTLVDLENYALTATNGQLLYATDAKKLYQVLDSALAEVGSGTGDFNYIENGNAEVNTNGWTVYANTTPAASPDDFGGTPDVGFTFTKSTSTPLLGSASFLLTKPASNVQGHGVYYEFTVEEGHKTQKLLLQMLSDTTLLDDGDLRVYLVSSSDNFASDYNVISPNNPDVLAGIPSILKQLQMDASDDTYRICLHYASADTTAKTAKFDEVSFGPKSVASGAIVTDWEDCSNTGSWTNLTVGNGTEICKIRRVGDTAYINYHLELGSTSSVSTAPQWTLPDSLVIDENKYQVSIRDVLGDGSIFDNGTRNYHIRVRGVDSTTVEPRYWYDFQGSSANAIGDSGITSTAPFTWTTSDMITFELAIPIQGWSSNAQMSEDLGGREVVVRGAGNAGANISGNVERIDFTSVEDSTTSWSQTDTHGKDTFTAPETGYYIFEGAIDMSANISQTIRTYVDNTLSKRVGHNYGSTSGQAGVQFSGIEFLTKGQTLDFRSTATFTAVNDSNDHWIHIQKLASAQTMLETETVAARYTTNSAQQLNNATVDVIVYEDIEYDTHGSYNTSNGRYIAPSSGYYNVSACYVISNLDVTVNVNLISYIRVNGSSKKEILDRFQGSQTQTLSGFVDGIVYMNKGDYLEIACYQDSGTNENLDTDPTRNTFSIIKIK